MVTGMEGDGGDRQNKFRVLKDTIFQLQNKYDARM